MSLILPCAGSSSRFPNMKPKWMLTSPQNNLMIQESIKGLDLENINDIYITVLKEHIHKYNFNDSLEVLFNFTNKKIHILQLNESTENQPETIIKTINHFNLSGPIFIKDCDNSFDFKIEKGNYICSLKIDDNNNVEKLYNKSFVQINEIDEIINISEKNIISDKICIGGYHFNEAKTFITLYDKINEKKNIFISHLVFQAIIDGIIFKSCNVNNYHDWGTLDDWNKYKNNFKTLFVDIDGTLFYNSSEFFVPKWGDSDPIIENIEYLKKLYHEGNTQIILTTSRKESFREITIKQLKKYEIPYDNIIFNLFHSKRYLINDYSDTNPYPTAISINLERNAQLLDKLL